MINSAGITSPHCLHPPPPIIPPWNNPARTRHDGEGGEGEVANAGDGEDGRGGRGSVMIHRTQQVTKRSRPPPKTQQSNYEEDGTLDTSKMITTMDDVALDSGGGGGRGRAKASK